MSGPIAFEAQTFEDEGTAAQAGGDWIEALTGQLVAVEDRTNLEITNERASLIVWRRGQPFAVALIVRDEANRARLIRWQAGPVE